MTILVLRGTIGAGYFGTPAQDYEEIRAHLQSSFRGSSVHPIRALAEIQEEKPSFKSGSAGVDLVMSVTATDDIQDDDEEDDEAATTNVSNADPAGVSDWDEQRGQWKKLQQNPNISSTTVDAAAAARRETMLPLRSMMLVTGSSSKPHKQCENAIGDHYLLKSFKNKLDYCRLHGIEMFYNTATLDRQMTGSWSKLPLLPNLMLGHPEVEWLWWMDNDAMFTDMSFRIPLEEKYQNYNLVLYGFNDSVYVNKSRTGLHTGSFLIRNCQWSLDLLDAWSRMGPEGSITEKAGESLTQSLVGRPQKSEADDDQSALVYLLITQTAKWAERVFLENTYFLHGYWTEWVDKFEEMMMMEKSYRPGSLGGDDEEEQQQKQQRQHRWPLVTNFVGCNLCSESAADYPVKQCVKQMEKAFNFGDNQILDIYGFQHKSLERPDVLSTKTNGNSDHPTKEKLEAGGGSSNA